MTIYESIKDMTQEIISKTQMLNQMSIIEFVSDLAVKVQSIDPVTFEYAVTDGNETFRTRNQSVFCNVLEWALS